MPSIPTPRTPSQTQPKPTKSGITTSSTGERHIPSSTRPDGSVRKEIRVRPGYRPPEDVEVYKNRTAAAWKNHGSGGVPGAEAVVVAGKEGGGEGKKDAGGEDDTAHKVGDAPHKNAKRREARRRAAAAAAAGNTAETNGKADTDTPTTSTTTNTSTNTPSTNPPETDTRAKEARKLTKKLRQARELRDRSEQEGGGVLLPEQFEKVIRINELIRQLDGLGFDANGEEKKEKGAVAEGLEGEEKRGGEDREDDEARRERAVS